MTRVVLEQAEEELDQSVAYYESKEPGVGSSLPK
jgi:hypothetical protein